jgi:putative ABC transport system ATP-binding protein
MLFQLDGVCAARAGQPVLADVDLCIEPGATAIVGPSGSGKSTLLRLLNRLADPDSGRVAYRGRDVTTLDILEHRRTVTLVPQLPALLEGTVADNVAYGPALAGRPAPDVARLLGLAGLDAAFADRDSGRLSVGERQRVMLARALALEPEVLLLDEPTSALDEESRDGVEETLRHLRDTLDVSLVFVTHDPEQAKRLATRIVRIQAGRVA